MFNRADNLPFSEIDRSDVYAFSKAAVADSRVRPLFQTWADSLETPFYGVTTDGVKAEDLYTLQDQGAPTAAAVIAANRFLDVLTADEKLRALHDLQSEDWFVNVLFHDDLTAQTSAGESGITLKSSLMTSVCDWKPLNRTRLTLYGPW
jgi:hypothetical protein